MRIYYLSFLLLGQCSLFGNSVPMFPVEAISPFGKHFSEKELKEFGLKKLSLEEAEKLKSWLDGKLVANTPNKENTSSITHQMPILTETLQGVKGGTIRLLDNSIWEIPESSQPTIKTWYPGQRLEISRNLNPDFPYTIYNQSSHTKTEAVYIEGSTRNFETLPPGFNFSVPVEAAILVSVDKGKGSFAMDDRTTWEIAPSDLSQLQKLDAPLELRFQKSLRKSYPFTFLEASSQTYFSAKPKLILRSRKLSSKNNHLNKIADNLNLGSIIALQDQSKWEVYRPNQEVSFSWKEGDLLQVKQSERVDYPAKLINESDKSFVYAKPFAEEKPIVTAAKKNTLPPRVQRVTDNGRFLYLNDGSSYRISAIDRGTVDFWLSNHGVEISSDSPDNPYVSITNTFTKETVRGKRM